MHARGSIFIPAAWRARPPRSLATIQKHEGDASQEDDTQRCHRERTARSEGGPFGPGVGGNRRRRRIRGWRNTGGRCSCLRWRGARRAIVGRRGETRRRGRGGVTGRGSIWSRYGRWRSRRRQRVWHVHGRRRDHRSAGARRGSRRSRRRRGDRQRDRRGRRRWRSRSARRRCCRSTVIRRPGRGRGRRAGNTHRFMEEVRRNALFPPGIAHDGDVIPAGAINLTLPIVGNRSHSYSNRPRHSPSE